MSHFILCVISKTTQAVPVLMDPYNQNHLFEPGGWIPDDEWIQRMLYRRDLFAKTGLYAEYLENPKAYLDRHKNLPNYIRYVTEDFPKMLKMNGEELSGYMQWDRTQWDEWSLIDQLAGPFLLKSGQHAKIARIGNIDWAEMQQEKLKFVTPYDQIDPDYKRLFYDESDYLKTESGFFTWAVLDEIGWHEPKYEDYAVSVENGVLWRRNWFGDFIESADKNDFLTILDCHI